MKKDKQDGGLRKKNSPAGWLDSPALPCYTFSMASDTIFDKIIRREIPADVVYEDEVLLAFRDINPQAPVHVIVIPKKKITGFDKLCELPDDYAGKYITGVSGVAKKLGLANGYRIVFNSGTDGQQTVEYIHAHILGGRQMNWPPG